MDLLEYAQKLIKSGDGSQQQQAYQLQTILQNSSATNKGENNSKHTALIIGGIVAVVIGSVLTGYL